MLRYALLALLSQAASHGYELKSALEELFGGLWELNIGQVYTTLNRLERDGLVTYQVERQDNHPDRKTYSITAQGREAVLKWLAEPAEEEVRLRDEPTMKIILQRLLHTGNTTDWLAAQKRRCWNTLAYLGDRREELERSSGARFAVEAATYHVEADLRLLNLVEDDLQERPS